MKTPSFLLILFAGLSGMIRAQSVQEAWNTMEGTQHLFVKSVTKVALDEKVYIAGATRTGSGDYDLLVVAYNGSGTLLWADQYDGTGSGDDMAAALTVVGGKLFVTGTTYTDSIDTLDVVTIGYDTSGTRDWVAVYAGTGGGADAGTAIAFDGGEIYVGGTTFGTGMDFLGLRYDTSGNLEWDASADYAGYHDFCTGLIMQDKSVIVVGAGQSSATDYDFWVVEMDRDDGSTLSTNNTTGGAMGFDRVHAGVRDQTGNIYLTGTVANGTTGYDVHTVMLDTNLAIIWQQDYSSSGAAIDEGKSIAVDASGNVHVGGYVTTATQGTNFLVLQYDASGNQNWAYTLDGAGSGNDTVKALTLDDQDRPHVTGTTWNGTSEDYLTLRLSTAGALNWKVAFNNKYNYNDRPTDIACTGDGGVVVTGQSTKPGNIMGYRTIKYFEPTFVMPVDTDSVSTSLRWIANHDQVKDSADDPVDRVKYYSNQAYPNLYFMTDTLSYVFARVDDDTATTDTMHRIDLSFTGANSNRLLLPLEKETYWHNYYLGHTPEGRPFVPLYKYLFVEEMWDGIDVAYSSNQRGLKYYFVVRRGTEPDDIALKYSGQDTLYVTGGDALRVQASIGEILQPQALAYEMDNSGALTLLNWQPDYVVSGSDVTFTNYGSWNSQKSLVIEVNWGYVDERVAILAPEWATYYAETSEDAVVDLTNDSYGNLYVAGVTQSPLFPINGQFSQAFDAGADFFVGMFLNNYSINWMTCYGGSGVDVGLGIAIDETVANRVYVCGKTSGSTNNPTPIPTLSANPLGGNPFLATHTTTTKWGVLSTFEMNTGLFRWGTFFGGRGSECYDVKTDNDGRVYVVGFTDETSLSNTCSSTGLGTSFPNCDQLSTDFNLGSNQSQSDGFIARFNSNLQLEWSTLFGGDGIDELYSLSLDPIWEKLYVGGKTTSKSQTGSIYTPGNCPTSDNYLPLCEFSTTGYFQSYLNGDNVSPYADGLIARFSTLDCSLEWSSFYGGADFDMVTEVAALQSAPVKAFSVPLSGVYVGGQTYSSTYNATPGAEPNPNDQGFPHYAPGNSFDQPFCNGCSGNPGDDGGLESFIAKLAGNTNLAWSTYLGGGRDEGFTGPLPPRIPRIAVSSEFEVFIAGASYSGSNGSTSIPVMSNAAFYEQPTHGNGSVFGLDAFVMGFSSSNQMFLSTFYGGTRYEYPSSISSINERLYIGGKTAGSVDDLPVPVPVVQSYMPPTPFGNEDAYMAQLQTSLYVGMEEAGVDELPQILAWPNPTDSELTLQWRARRGGFATITLLGVLGNEIVRMEAPAIAGQNSILPNIASLPSGLYLVNLALNGEQYSVKIIKQ